MDIQQNRFLCTFRFLSTTFLAVAFNLISISCYSQACGFTEATFAAGGSFAGNCTLDVGFDIDITGDVVITGGEIVINGANTAQGFLNVTTGSITIQNGGTLRMDDQDLTVESGGTITVEEGGTLEGDFGDNIVVQGFMEIFGTVLVPGNDFNVDGGEVIVRGDMGFLNITGDDLKVFNGGILNVNAGATVDVNDRVGNGPAVPISGNTPSPGTIILNGTMTVGNTFEIGDTTPDSGLTGAGSLTVTNGFTDDEGGDFTGCGGGGTCMGVGSLPVEFLFFSAEYVNQSVQLQWATATEITNSHFEIERSLNAEVFETIGEVAGNGDSEIRIDYEYYDYEASQPGEDLYYRLKQVDFDGKFEYSNTVIARRSELPLLEVVVRPNPFLSDLTLTMRASDEEPVQLNIFDLNGSLIYQADHTIYEGTNDLEVEDLDFLTPGVYVVNLAGYSFNVNRRLIKSK